MEGAIALDVIGKAFVHTGDRSSACVEKQNKGRFGLYAKKIRLREEA
jgi:hypothetical protein